jgi:Ca2+-binding RTX toxin-like protein
MSTGTTETNVWGGTVNNDFVSGLGGPDNLVGFAGDDTLVGGAGIDGLNGGPGSDLYLPGPGADSISEAILGPDAVGVDTVSYIDSTAGVTIDLNGNDGDQGAGDALGDSCYEALMFVRGTVRSLGADCVKKEMRPEHIELLKELLAEAQCDAKPEEFTRYGSARNLYNFDVDNAAAY